MTCKCILLLILLCTVVGPPARGGVSCRQSCRHMQQGLIWHCTSLPVKANGRISRRACLPPTPLLVPCNPVLAIIVSLACSWRGRPTVSIDSDRNKARAGRNVLPWILPQGRGVCCPDGRLNTLTRPYASALTLRIISRRL